MKKLSNKKLISGNEESPVHDWFELTYASYLILPRTLLHSMPYEWQKKFVELINELDDTMNWRREGSWAKFKNKKGRYMIDELSDYERGRRVLSPKQISDIVERHNKNFDCNEQ